MKEINKFSFDSGEVTKEEMILDLEEAIKDAKEIFTKYKPKGALIVLSFMDEKDNHLSSGTILGMVPFVHQALSTFLEEFNKTMNDSLDNKGTQH